MNPQKYSVLILFIILTFVQYKPADAQLNYSEGKEYAGSIGRPVMAPDGESFYASINVYDPATDDKIDTIMHFSLDGDELDTEMPKTPFYSPDGKYIAFDGTRDDKSGLWIYDIAKKEYRLIAKIIKSNAFLGHRSRKNFVWSPDGRHIAYLTAEKEAEVDPDGILVFTRILFKSRKSFSDNLKTHIFIASVNGDEPRQLTHGPYDEFSITWSPDGNRIAFISNRTDDPDNNHNNDLWTVDVRTGIITQVTDTPGTEHYPVWSPGGTYIAYLAGVRPTNSKDSPAEIDHLWIIPAEGGSPENMTKPLDRRIVNVFWKDPGQFSNITWSDDDRYVYFMVFNHGGVALHRVSIMNRKIESIVSGDIRVGTFALSARKNRIIYTLSDHKNPVEIWSAALDGTNKRQLTHYQDTFLEKVTISAAESFYFDSFDGTRVQGWLLKPNPCDAGRKYPLIMMIHGGPHSYYGFTLNPTYQNFAETGYGVLYFNIRGSRGYGQKFLDGTINNWGGGDYRDLMAGVDYALEHNEWIDEDRMGVTGGSYGGYMTNWVITQTDRFSAAVTYASLTNLISFYGTSLYHLLIENEFPGNIWDNYDLLWHWSPMSHVKNVTTPTLFIHGDVDHDVPITQAEEMYVALKKLGVDTEFVRYPGEGHGFSSSKFSKDYERRKLEWFNKYLHPEKVVSIN